jgi:hypothetical protein
VVDLALVDTMVGMIAALRSDNPARLATAVLNRELAIRFRKAGLIREALTAAQLYMADGQRLATAYRDESEMRVQCRAIEVYLAAHELGHIILAQDQQFSKDLRAKVVDTVVRFVKSQRGAGVRSGDPAVSRHSRTGVAEGRERTQAGWVALLQADESVQEELSADDLARMVLFSASYGPGIREGVVVFLTQLNILILEQLDVLVAGYINPAPPKDASARLLRAEYAAVDLAHLLPQQTAVEKADVVRQLGAASIAHKQLYDEVLYESIVPLFGQLHRARAANKDEALTPDAKIRGRTLLEALISE